VNKTLKKGIGLEKGVEEEVEKGLRKMAFQMQSKDSPPLD
jgi:hypothetical protein